MAKVPNVTTEAGPRVFLVVYDDGGLYPYAIAFSERQDADAWSLAHDGNVIETHVDAHVDVVGRTDRGAL